MRAHRAGPSAEGTAGEAEAKGKGAKAAGAPRSRAMGALASASAPSSTLAAWQPGSLRLILTDLQSLQCKVKSVGVDAQMLDTCTAAVP